MMIPQTEEFEAGYSFPLDPFQREAAAALEKGKSVLVCAPTGAGKTVVGEYGVWLALREGGKAFYTTPIKALSNQKFGDFVARYGAERVGLLTGDNSINGEAPVVVMTTEVLRNMLYEDSPTLDGLAVVVMDEVHYLRDPYRGATWEEVFIHLPPGVRMAALSATVSNAEEFGEWLRSVRGETEVVVEQRRPVPIEHVYMTGPNLQPMFVREDGASTPNPALRRFGGDRYDGRRDGRGRGRGARGYDGRGARGGRGGYGGGRSYRPNRVEVIERLRDEGLLPAITFVFSRAGCEQAVRICRAAGLSLNDPGERERVREYVEMRASVLPEDDLAVLGYDEWLDGLERGIAAHHAGIIPLFKETVEELFERALVKAVFATETLALGINMPAKTVVIERLVKFTGERHEMLTPADYTQLVGRAGRRGMDEVGYGITLLQRDIQFERIAALAEGRSYPLVSSFRPSYNMAVNLLRNHTAEQATRLLNLSFAQFLADRGVVHQERRIEHNERYVEGYRSNTVCDRGDFAEYWALVRAARASAKRESPGRSRRRQRRTARPATPAPEPSPARREALAALRAHPVHACPERAEHERWMERIEGLEAETAALRKRVRARTGTLARTFERVIEMLQSYEYLDGETVTEKGERLSRIYNESDLLIAEALAAGVLDGLAPPDLAAAVSTFVYETRAGVPDESFPTGRCRDVFRSLARLYRAIHDREEDLGLELVREPDPGFMWQIHAWAGGESLDDVLAEGEMPAGDFVRNVKQVWDLLRQLAEVGWSDALSANCRETAHAVYRGVVAYSGAL